MKRSSGTRRATSILSDSLHHQLNMYALAAEAAGVGMLVLAQPAQARIVYTQTNQAIGQGLTLDLNNDGIADFKIQPFSCCTDVEYFLLAFSLGSANRVFGGHSFFPTASKLPAHYRVGTNSAQFQKGYTFPSQTRPAKALFICTNSTGNVRCRGPWIRGWGGYLGFKFFIKGKIHYGWARLVMATNLKRPNLILTGYAYETIPNKPIITGKTKGPDDGGSIEQPNPTSTTPNPEPATLGALAMGAPGLSIWRREESVGVAPQL